MEQIHSMPQPHVTATQPFKDAETQVHDELVASSIRNQDGCGRPEERHIPQRLHWTQASSLMLRTKAELASGAEMLHCLPSKLTKGKIVLTPSRKDLQGSTRRSRRQQRKAERSTRTQQTAESRRSAYRHFAGLKMAEASQAALESVLVDLKGFAGRMVVYASCVSISTLVNARGGFGGLTSSPASDTRLTTSGFGKSPCGARRWSSSWATLTTTST